MSDALHLAKLTVEYFDNLNAAGEYCGNNPELRDHLDSDVMKSLAYKVIQQEEMRIWNV